MSQVIGALCIIFIIALIMSEYHAFRFEMSASRFRMYERLAPDVHWRICMGGFTDERFRDARAFRRKHGGEHAK